MKIIPISLPTPFPVGNVNVYLIREEPLTLVDTGVKSAESLTVLREKLRENGVECADLQRIFLTHTHEDHCGAAKILRDESNAEIYVHEWEKGLIFGRVQEDVYALLLKKLGIPDAMSGEISRVYDYFHRFSDSVERADCRIFRDGEEMEFASGVLKVLHLPGHTAGSVGFWREANRTLLSGDCILKRITPNPILTPDPFDETKRFSSLGEYMVSLARVRSLAPTLIQGGHGEPIYDFEEVFNRYLKMINARQETIIRLIDEKGLTAFETARKIFPDAMSKNSQRFLALSETVAHLDYAAQEGRISLSTNAESEFYFR